MLVSFAFLEEVGVGAVPVVDGLAVYLLDCLVGDPFRGRQRGNRGLWEWTGWSGGGMVGIRALGVCSWIFADGNGCAKQILGYILGNVYLASFLAMYSLKYS